MEAVGDTLQRLRPLVSAVRSTLSSAPALEASASLAIGDSP